MRVQQQQHRPEVVSRSTTMETGFPTGATTNLDIKELRAPIPSSARAYTLGAFKSK